MDFIKKFVTIGLMLAAIGGIVVLSNRKHSTTMKKLSKNKWLRFFVITIGIVLVLYLLDWRFLNYVPLDWNKYTNTSRSHHYSFSYPREWVLTECGNGEVVVAKKAIEQCLRPLEATDEYLDNVYLQVFIPGEKHAAIPYDKASPSARLADWSTRFYYFDEETAILNDFTKLSLNEYAPYWGNAFIVKPDSDSLYEATTNEGKKITVGYLTSFTIGFYPHPEAKEKLKYVRNSIRYDYK